VGGVGKRSLNFVSIVLFQNSDFAPGGSSKLFTRLNYYRLSYGPGGRAMTQVKKTANPKVTIIASKGANQAINYLLEDRDELDWLVAIGRNKNGDIFFYDTGGDIIQDLGAIEYIKERIVRDYFGESDE
jgi:hypothetical protein